MATIEKIPGEWNCTAEEYHADVLHVSHSALEVFRRSRRLYHGRFISGEIERPEPTAAMQIGTLLHLALLEPERFRAAAIEAPKCDRRTKAGRAAWAEFREQAAGKLVVTGEEMQLVGRMAGAVISNAIAREWLSAAGKSEHSIIWQDNETGLLCKSRRDLVIANAILDLKTCRDASPEAFARSAATFGYFRQAAWYLDGEQATGGTATGFVFIAVSSEPPHEVACYTPNMEDVADARVQNRTELFKLADCIEHDDWLGPHEKQQTELSLPRWVKYANEYEVSE